ncbi:hypothetical protein Tco_0113018, partial [Tanacetum coccineum]
NLVILDWSDHFHEMVHDDKVSGFGIGVDEFTLSSLEVLLILDTFDGLDVGLFEDVIGEDDCDDDDCDEMSLVRMLVDGC